VFLFLLLTRFFFSFFLSLLYTGARRKRFRAFRALSRKRLCEGEEENSPSSLNVSLSLSFFYETTVVGVVVVVVVVVVVELLLERCSLFLLPLVVSLPLVA
jgi:hypothetical protein